MASTTKDVGIVTTNRGSLTVLMVLANFKKKHTAQRAQTIGPDGEVVTTDDVFFQRKQVLTADGTQLTGYVAPKPGDTLVVDTGSFVIQEMEESETPDGKPQLSLTLERDYQDPAPP